MELERVHCLLHGQVPSGVVAVCRGREREREREKERAEKRKGEREKRHREGWRKTNVKERGREGQKAKGQVRAETIDEVRCDIPQSITA